jgi:DNA repair exonuclease SbcCD ATPase subunit
MKGLFVELRRTMQTVATESERIRKLVRETYQVFREDFDSDLTPPKVFLPMTYRVEIELLYKAVEAFRHSPSTVLASQRTVARRFNERMVSRAEVLFDQLRASYDGWIRDTLRPLAEEIQEHKSSIEKRLENLQRIDRSKEALQKRIDDMQTQYVGLAQELTALRNIHNALHYDPLTEQEAPQRPRLVSG